MPESSDRATSSPSTSSIPRPGVEASRAASASGLLGRGAGGSRRGRPARPGATNRTTAAATSGASVALATARPSPSTSTAASPSPTTATGVRSVTSTATVPSIPRCRWTSSHPRERRRPARPAAPQVDVDELVARGRCPAGSTHRIGGGACARAGDPHGVDVEQRRAQGDGEARRPRPARARRRRGAAAGAGPRPAAPRSGGPGSAGRSWAGRCRRRSRRPPRSTLDLRSRVWRRSRPGGSRVAARRRRVVRTSACTSPMSARTSSAARRRRPG